jgi:enamine deaminase RidA (YjgF/YER057c/UK114 family)
MDMDGFRRVPCGNPKDGLAASLVAGRAIFLSGISASNGAASESVPGTIEGQVRAAARNVNNALGLAAWTEEPLSRMVKYTVYVKKGAADPGYVMRLFNEECQKLAPTLAGRPGAGNCAVVSQLMQEDLMLMVDVIGVITE